MEYSPKPITFFLSCNLSSFGAIYRIISTFSLPGNQNNGGRSLDFLVIQSFLVIFRHLFILELLTMVLCIHLGALFYQALFKSDHVFYEKVSTQLYLWKCFFAWLLLVLSKGLLDLWKALMLILFSIIVLATFVRKFNLDCWRVAACDHNTKT